MSAMKPRLAALVAAAMILGGCGGSPEPQPLPKPTARTSPSASVTPSAPVVPEAAKDKTKAGAIAFARTFLQVLNYAGASGDTRPLRALYIRLCTRCEAIADGIDQTYAEGGDIQGGNWRPTSFKFYAIDNHVAFLDAVVDYDAQTWTKRRGAKPDQFPASEKNLKAFNLRWRGAKGWAVSALDPNQ